MYICAFTRYTVPASTIFSSSPQCRKTRVTTDRVLGFVLTFALLFAMVLLGCYTAAAQTTFQHPGVLVSRAQLDFIKAQVAAHADPIYTAYQKAVASPYGSLTYTVKGPPAGGIIDCGPFSSPDHGCSASDSDGTAALTQALLWYISGNHVYAQNAINILNTYGRNLKGYTNHNAPLQAGWDSQKYPAAAEIIRYSNAGWSASDIQTFQNMLRNVVQPMIQNGSGGNGNWELSMIDGMMAIAVFNDDHTLFGHAVTFWQQRVPAYFYYHTDGSTHQPAPRGSPSWYGQTVFNSSVDGVAQETCRDFGHTSYGIAGATHAAETAHIQGLSLFESEEPRLIAALEFHAFYQLGNPVPASVCGGKVTLSTNPTYEVGYNEFHNRRGMSLPHTLSWIENGIRTQADPVNFRLIVFETLTHGADAGSATPTPTPTPTPKPTPTATPTPKPTPTATATPTPTPSPTATPTPTPKPTATPTPTPVACVTATGGHGFTNNPFASKTGTFTATFDATPGAATTVNDVIGLSQGMQTSISGFPALVSFSDTGAILARDGGSYKATTTVNYKVGSTYHFRMVVNVSTRTYSIFVTPPGGGEVTIGNNFAFRTGVSVTALNSVGSDVTPATGSLTYCNFAVH